MGGGRRRQVPLRQYVGAVPRQERQLGMQVSHGVLLGPGGRCPDDHWPHRPHRRLHHLRRGHVHHQRLSVHHDEHSVDRRRGSPDHRSNHLPGQIQRSDLRGPVLVHLGLRVRLGRHHHLPGLRHPLLLPAALRGRPAQAREGQISLHLILKTNCTRPSVTAIPTLHSPLEHFYTVPFHQKIPPIS